MGVAVKTGKRWVCRHRGASGRYNDNKQNPATSDEDDCMPTSKYQTIWCGNHKRRSNNYECSEFFASGEQLILADKYVTAQYYIKPLMANTTPTRDKYRKKAKLSAFFTQQGWTKAIRSPFWQKPQRDRHRHRMMLWRSKRTHLPDSKHRNHCLYIGAFRKQSHCGG